jgi:hypothetical protein
MTRRSKKSHDDPVGEWATWQKNRYIEGFAADLVHKKGQLLPKYANPPIRPLTLVNTIYQIGLFVSVASAAFWYSRYFIAFVASIIIASVMLMLLIVGMVCNRLSKKSNE